MVLTDTTFKKLQNIVGISHCSRKKEDLICYAYDATARSYLPSAVLFPRDAREISAILHLANSDRFYVIPKGLRYRDDWWISSCERRHRSGDGST